jgi:light-regulated signal transduction histidine kinase (bacteriophytochrome)
VQLPPEASAELERLLGEDIPESLRFILNGAAKMDALLKGLLRLSRLGRAALNIEDLDMQRLVAEAASALDYQLAEAGGRITLGELPACRADDSQVTQVFVNLIDNAIKYRSTERPLHIEISGEIEEGRVRYRVRDNGVGINEAHRAKVFEIFHRLEDVDVDGEGLGLTIA